VSAYYTCFRLDEIPPTTRSFFLNDSDTADDGILDSFAWIDKDYVTGASGGFPFPMPWAT